jgi:Skp family chaperone for outer membrane proteins
MIKKAPISLALLLVFMGGLFLLYQQGIFSRFFGSHSVSVPQSVRFGVVDMNRVRNESEPFKALKAYVEDRYSESSRIIFNSENELRAEYKQLREKEKRASKGDKELLKNRQNFEKKVVNIEQMVQQKKSALNEKFIEITGRIEKKLQSIIQGLAEKNGLDAILNQSVGDDVVLVLYSSQHLDLTDIVIDALNAEKNELQPPS